MGQPNTARPSTRQQFDKNAPRGTKPEQLLRQRLVAWLLPKWRHELTWAGDLSRTIRQMLGLFQTGVTDLEEVSRIMRIERSAAYQMRRKLLRCKHPVIREALKFGLTGDASVLLREGCKVRCQKCRCMVDRVPCVRCAPSGFGIDLDGWTGQADPPLIEPAETTDLIPGSPEKIELMRKRVERWEMPCHPNDRKHDPAYTVETDTMSVNTGELVAILHDAHHCYGVGYDE